MANYYRHFKGGKYKLLGIAKDSETQEKMVVYQALYGFAVYIALSVIAGITLVAFGYFLAK